MEDKYKALREAAEKATPGPWTAQDDHGSRWIETTIGNDDAICEILRRDSSVGFQRDVEFHANAALIAAANPATIQALLAERDALRRVLRRAVDAYYKRSEESQWVALIESAVDALSSC